MRTKKTAAIIISAALALSLTGCSGNTGNAGNTGNTGNQGGATAANSEKVNNKTIDVRYTGETLSGTYSGEWSNNKANGEGEFVFSDDGYDLAISGTFKNGEPDNVSLLEEYSDGTHAFYVGKMSGGMPNDSNAYFETVSNGQNLRYQGNMRNGTIEGQGDMVFVMDDGRYVRYIGTFTNNNPTSGDYQVYSSNGKLEESGKVINGNKKTDSELVVENIVDNIGRAVEQHYGFNGLYDSLKSIIS